MAKFEKGKSGNAATQFQTGNTMQKAKGYEQSKTRFKRVLETVVKIDKNMSSDAESEDIASVTAEEAIIIAITKKAMQGDVAAAAFLQDRLNGKAVAAVKIDDVQRGHNMRYQSLAELRAQRIKIEAELAEYPDIEDTED